METKLDRIKEAVRYLKGKGIISAQQEIATKMNYGKSSVSLALNGNEKYFTDSFIKNFNKAFDNIFNIEYLIDGGGVMLMEDEARFDNDVRFLTLYDSLKRKKGINFDYEFCEIYNFNIENLNSVLSGERNIEERDFVGTSEDLLKFKDWIFTGKNSPFLTGELEFADNGGIMIMRAPNGMVMMHDNVWKKIQQSLNEYEEYLNGHEDGNVQDISSKEDRLLSIIESQQRAIEELSRKVK